MNLQYILSPVVLVAVIPLLSLFSIVSYGQETTVPSAGATTTPVSTTPVSNAPVTPEAVDSENGSGPDTGQELLIDSYELSINGETMYLQLGELTQIDKIASSKDGKNRICLRISPLQLTKMNSLQFRYPYPSRAFDNQAKEDRTIQIFHELGFVILITDFGSALSEPETNLPKIVQMLEDTIRKQMSDEPKTSPNLASQMFEFQAKNATVRGVRVQFRRPDGKILETIVMGINGKEFFATCTIQLFNQTFANVQEMIYSMIQSFEKKQ